MEVRFYQIDAFTDRVFGGNPAGVCFLDEWVADAILKNVAAENNLPETAFLVGTGNHYELRWFTPEVEIDLCGHGTLASAFAVFQFIQPDLERVDFRTKGGPLSVKRARDLLIMDFPARRPEPCPPPDGLDQILGAPHSQTLRSRDLVVVYETEEQIRGLSPDLGRLARLDFFGVIVTAPGRSCDFVSRFFAPGAGIPEDPVTGSAHCSLIPYWSERLGKKELRALQLSKRGGELSCVDQGERVAIGGKAATYLTGTIRI